MAVNKFTGSTNSDWSTATNWSLGTVPTASDGNVATFDATSPACSLSSNVTCNNLDFAAYTNTINISTRTITVGGNLTFGSGMTTTGTGGINISRNSTVTSNGYIFPGNFGTTSQQDGTTGSFAVTFADNFECLGSLSIASGLSPAGMNFIGVGLTLRFGGNFSLFPNGNRTLAGSIKLIATGSGTLNTGVNSWIGTEFEINASGTYTFGALFYIRNTFTYVAGTTDTGTGTVAFGANTHNINVNGDTSPSCTTVSSTGINFYNLNTTLAGTLTLVTPIRVINSHSEASAIFSAGSLIYNKGSYTLTNSSGPGTYKVIMDGTGAWSGNFLMRHLIEINTTGTITLNGKLQTNGGSIKYISGTTVCNDLLTLAGITTLDVNGDTNPAATTTSTTGINFNNVTSTTGVAHVVTGNIRICGTHITGAANFGTGKNIYNSGSYNVTTNTGAALFNYYMIGTGTWSGGGSARHNLIINTTGTITLSGNLAFGGINNATLTYIAGTIIQSSAILRIGLSSTSTTLNTNTLVWDRVDFIANNTTTLTSTLNANSIYFLATVTSFIGPYGFNTNNLSCTLAGTQITLDANYTYNVYTSLILAGTIASKILIRSNNTTILSNFILGYAASQNVTNTDATRINSNGGQTIYTTFNSTLTTTNNWGKAEGDMLLMYN